MRKNLIMLLIVGMFAVAMSGMIPGFVVWAQTDRPDKYDDHQDKFNATQDPKGVIEPSKDDAQGDKSFPADVKKLYGPKQDNSTEVIDSKKVETNKINGTSRNHPKMVENAVGEVRNNISSMKRIDTSKRNYRPWKERPPIFKRIYSLPKEESVKDGK